MNLTIAAALAIAVQCAPGVDPMMLVGIAKHESGLDPTRVNHNKNGTTDYGLLQINSANFGWLGLTPESAMDPCKSMRAGAEVLRSISAYNTGSTTRGFGNGYVGAVTDAVRAVRASAGAATPETSVPLPAPPATDRSPVIIGPGHGHALTFPKEK